LSQNDGLSRSDGVTDICHFESWKRIPSISWPVPTLYDPWGFFPPPIFSLLNAIYLYFHLSSHPLYYSPSVSLYLSYTHTHTHTHTYTRTQSHTLFPSPSLCSTSLSLTHIHKHTHTDNEGWGKKWGNCHKAYVRIEIEIYKI
jgi:hypothetical protein